jgi:hypothetical protein
VDVDVSAPLKATIIQNDNNIGKISYEMPTFLRTPRRIQDKMYRFVLVEPKGAHGIDAKHIRELEVISIDFKVKDSDITNTIPETHASTSSIP